jgi:hypothetical protein
MKSLKEIKQEQEQERLKQQNAQVTQLVKEIDFQDSQRIIESFEISTLLKSFKKK